MKSKDLEKKHQKMKSIIEEERNRSRLEGSRLKTIQYIKEQVYKRKDNSNRKYIYKHMDPKVSRQACRYFKSIRQKMSTKKSTQLSKKEN